MKKMNKTLAIAIAAAMVSPSAFAAQDTSGMQFTSASEGFYASIRTRLDFSDGDGGSAGIDDNSSRIGVRGTNDLGGGLEGFYQWEGEIFVGDRSNGTGAFQRARLGHVGLRGAFGELAVGGFWTADYSFTHGGTDIANNYSGWIENYTDERESRSESAIQYTTPDLNGFQGAIRVDVGSKDGTLGARMREDRPMRIVVAPDGSTSLSDQKADGSGPLDPIVARVARSDNDIDSWNIAAQYNIQGFSVGASYNNQPDQLNKYDSSGGPTNGDIIGYDDKTSWSIKTGYAQDNWYVNGWYGEDNDSDNGNANSDDKEFFSVAGGVSVDKVNLYILHTTVEENYSGMGAGDDSYTTLGAQYNLGSNSRVWVEYFAQEYDSSDSEEDIVSVGLRHDF